MCYNCNNNLNYLNLGISMNQYLEASEFMAKAPHSQYALTKLKELRAGGEECWKTATTEDFVKWKFSSLTRNVYTDYAILETDEDISVDIDGRKYIIAKIFKYTSNLDIYSLTLGISYEDGVRKDFVDYDELMSEWITLLETPLVGRTVGNGWRKM